MNFCVGALLSAALFFGTLPAAAKDWSTVRIGFDGTYPGFNEFTDDGGLEGFDVDIADALCEQMRVRCEYYSAHADTGLAILPLWLTGRRTPEKVDPPLVDAILSSMWITEERKERFAFTRPYYRSSNALVVPLRYWDEVGKIERTSDLNGKPIAVVAGSPQEAYARKHFPNAHIQTYPSVEELQSTFASVPSPAFILGDAVEMYAWIDKGEEGSCCGTMGTFWADPDPGINGEGAGIMLRKRDEDLRRMFDDALVAILENGTYDKIAKRYFRFDIFGAKRP